MRSVLFSEPASPGEILLEERSEQIDALEGTFTIYLGSWLRIGFPWKSHPGFFGATGGLLLAEFISSTVLDSVEAHIAKTFSSIEGIERIYVRKDHDFFRVWVVIPDFDLVLEDKIHAAELKFMDQFPGIPFDFSVIFRQGKKPDSIQPLGARQPYPSA